MGSAFYQYLTVFCVNLCTIGYGCSVGWMASAFLILTSENCPLPTGRVLMSEIAWVGAILGIGGLVGTVFVGWLADFAGRKNSLLLMAVPQIISLMLIIYAQNVYYLYASRFLLGFVGGAVFVVIPLMVAEIAEDRIRGTLCSILTLSSSGGVVLGFIAGHFLEYHDTPRVTMIFPILFFVFFSLVPETPYYLIKTDRLEDAEKSLRFYRNVSKDSKSENKLFELELSKLKNSYQQMKQRASCDDKEKLAISDFMSRPFSIGVILMILHEFCGCFTMTSYAGIIFSRSGSTLSPSISAIIIGTIQFFGAYISTILVDRLGRKLLMMVSFMGTGLSHTILGTYVLLSATTNINLSSVHWIPVATFSMMLFIGSCGALPIPYVILSEILPDKIRGIGTTFCLCISWGLTFLMVKGFPPFVALIELYGCIYFFAACCFLSVFYVLHSVPETKGKSLEEILAILKA